MNTFHMALPRSPCDLQNTIYIHLSANPVHILLLNIFIVPQIPQLATAKNTKNNIQKHSLYQTFLFSPIALTT